ncbi:tyrosine-type recombinase/integrase [Acinetobacter ursingii]|uniref:tyrosine-type recombinase/integrase n=1 Tax=Acinetobacter ursingii TaxID=108980 RepID=UPI0021E2B667|nr:tyrosine-type recombinase/integrase [Acinetobacter ursingii]UYF80228.1 tyrosine-type recombinase/integrase [Acinetobacter ursingii]
MKRDAIKKRPLSDTVLASLDREDKEYRELDSNNLYFRVKPNGSKSWQFRYKKPDGKWSWLGLGSYPSVSGSLARKKAIELMNQIDSGEVLQTQQATKQQQLEISNRTVKALMDEWLDIKKQSWGKDTYDKAVKSIEKHIIPKFGQRDYTTITPKEWLTFFESLQRDLGIFNQVEKLTGWVRSAYDRAKFQEKISFNPLEGITKQLESYEGGNMKFVELHELPELIYSIRTYPKRNIAIGLELFVLLFPRPQELRFAKWDQFNYDRAVWEKPAEIMKKNKPHAVPLSKQVIALLKELEQYRTESEFLFPSRSKIDESVSDMTFNTALNRLGYKGRQNPHGFRHIASTALNNKFSDKDQVIEAALAHYKKGVKGAYDKATHFEERIGIMQWWADYVEELTDNKVIQFKKCNSKSN